MTSEFYLSKKVFLPVILKKGYFKKERQVVLMTKVSKAEPTVAT